MIQFNSIHNDFNLVLLDDASQLLNDVESQGSLLHVLRMMVLGRFENDHRDGQETNPAAGNESERLVTRDSFVMIANP